MILALVLALSCTQVPEGDAFGAGVVGVGDLDGDGVSDLAITDTYHVWLVSGKRGRVLRRVETELVQASPPRPMWAQALARAGDVDGDCQLELAMSWFTARGSVPQCVVAFLSLVDGSVLRRFEAEHVHLAGDVDRDGIVDVLVEGRVVSGRTQEPLDERFLALPPDGEGIVEPVGDVDGDGRPDFVYVTRYAATLSSKDGETVKLFGPPDEGDVHVVADSGDLDGGGRDDLLIVHGRGDHHALSAISSESGEELYRLRIGNDGGTPFATSLGDLDGDGVPDFAARDDEPLDDKLSLFSGADGKRLRVVEDLDLQRTILTAHALDDLDGDGTVDYAVGEIRSPWAGRGPGNVRVYSGRSGELLHLLTRKKAFGELESAFDARVYPLDDRDGDGAPDLALRDGPDVWLVSGRTGAVIERNPGIELPPLAHVDDGELVLGDLTGDGVAERAVRDDSPFEDVLELVDGATGEVLAEIEGLDPQHTVLTPYPLGDVDGDGTPDFAVGEVRVLPSGPGPSNVRAFSGRTRTRLYMLDRHRVQHSYRASQRRKLAYQVHDPPPTAADRFGVSVARIDDLDGDGVDELLVGNPWSGEPTDGNGEVWIFSGLDGAPAALLTGMPGFGFAVCGAGDVDGDGTSDVLVGSARERADLEDVLVEVCSGKYGSVLYSYFGPELDTSHEANVKHHRRHWHGAHVAAAGDLDGDGRAEFIAGDRVYSGATGKVVARYPGAGLQVAGLVDDDDVLDYVALPPGPDRGPGSVIVYSGVDGSVLRRFPHEVEARNNSSLRHIFAFAPLPDLDGDLVPDFAVSYGKRLQVYTGLGWRIDRVDEGPRADRVVALGDLDGDRRAEILVTRIDPEFAFRPDAFRVLSGKDGGVLAEHASPLDVHGFLAPARLGDVDLDGVDDLAVGFTRCDWTGPGHGVVRVYSGASQRLLYELSRESARARLPGD